MKTAPTCTAVGVYYKHCSVCGANSTETFEGDAPLGHNYVPVVTPPSCGAQGYTTYTCSRCQDSYVADYTEALTHNFVNKENKQNIKTAGDCTHAPVYYKSCAYCGLKSDETFEGNAPLGHDYKAVVTAPTCTTDGYTTYTCTRCADSYTGNFVTATGHIAESPATCQSKAKCKNCSQEFGELDPSNHSGKTEVRNFVKATCTTDGYSGDLYCLGCEAKISDGEVVVATGHTADNWLFDSEYHWKVCKVCSEQLDKAAHTESDWIVDAHATSATDGRKHKECTVCRCMTKSEVIPKLDSPGEDVPQIIVESVITDPGKSVDVNISFKNNPGITSAKLTVSFPEALSLSAVTFGDIGGQSITSPELNSPFILNWFNGLSDFETSDFVFAKLSFDLAKDITIGKYDIVVDYNANDVFNNAGNNVEFTKVNGGVTVIAHNYIPNVTEPTCTEQGYTTYICSLCGDTYVGDYTDPLGHNGGVATCHSKAVCERCKVEYGNLDPNNHDGETEIRNQVAASCFATGYTGDTYCLGCGEKIADGKTIPLTDHTLGDWLNNSETHWHACAVCNDKFDEAAHTAGDWIVDTHATVETEGSKHKECTVCGYVMQIETIPVLEYMLGDINGDNVLNNKDLIRLLKYLSGWDVEVNTKALDVNGDKAVNNKDLTRLFRYLAGQKVEIF